MSCSYELFHVGINCDAPEEAAELTELFCKLFNLAPRHGNRSEFAGDYFELMKTPYLGKHGHIAMLTDDLDAAVEELRGKGFEFRMDTATYNEDGSMRNVYMADEFGGFAIHIMKQFKR